MAKSRQKTEKGSAKIGRRVLGSKRMTSLPAYHQLYVVLRQKIIDQQYPEDKPIPSEFTLAEAYNVSRVTVRRTFDLLENDGLIERRQGIGTFAVGNSKLEDTTIRGVLENLITIGLETSAQTLAFEKVLTPIRVHAALRTKKEEKLLCIERLRTHSGKPFSLTKVWLPPECSSLISKKELGNKPVAIALENAGLNPISADQSISAILADDHSASLLGVDIGAALIRLRRTVFAADGVPLLVQQSLYAPDRYEYHMQLSRHSNEGRPQWRHIG